MKKIFTLFLVLLSLALGAEAQNQYYNYASSYVTQPTSVACITHSDHAAYFFQTEHTHTISVAKINAVSMQLAPSSHQTYAFSDSITLVGGFEDFNLDFVLYGSIDSTNWSRPSLYIMDYAGLPNSVHKNIVFRNNPNINSFLDGCRGLDVNQVKVYMFVCDNGMLCAYHSNNLPHPIILVPDSGKIYTDISWDEAHQCFIASGSFPTPPNNNPGLFVDVFSLDIQSALSGGSALTHLVSYNLFNYYVNGVSEYKSLHTKIDNNHLVVYRDLREEYYDAIWLTRIKNYWTSSRSVVDSRFFYIPAHKLSAFDMIYDSVNNRLNFLGEMNYCKEGPTYFLSQVNPYTLSNMMSGQLGANFASISSLLSMAGPWQYFYASDLFAKKLVLNYHNPCSSVLIPGIVNGQSFLTETYDISQSVCDIPMQVWETSDYPTLTPTTIHETFTIDTVLLNEISATIDPHTANILCDDPEACSNWNQGRNVRSEIVVTNMNPDIILHEPTGFTCEYFMGTIHFFVTDMAGKMLKSGKTHNGEKVSLYGFRGVLLIHAVDENGQEKVKKVIFYD